MLPNAIQAKQGIIKQKLIQGEEEVGKLTKKKEL